MSSSKLVRMLQTDGGKNHIDWQRSNDATRLAGKKCKGSLILMDTNITKK